MEYNNQFVDFIWLPPEEDLSEVTSLLQLKLQDSFPKKGPLAHLKCFMNKHLNFCVKICDLKRKIAIGSINEYTGNKNDIPVAMFYSEYLYKVSGVITPERTNLNMSDSDMLQKIIKSFCCERYGNNCPELWLKIDTSVFIDRSLSTQNYFIDLKGFSLGNIVKLNKFVEHFSSDSSLEPHHYKITQVKVKFLHDEQVMHVHFVIGNSKVSVKKRSATSHRMYKLIIPYSSIHTVLLCHTKHFTVYFRLYKSPMLFTVEQDEDAENYVSYMDLKNNTKWIRTVNIFEDCPPSMRKEFSMNYVLRLIFCHENYEVVKLILHHKSVQLYFTPMLVVSYKHTTPPFQFEDFDCLYGSYCLLTHSYEALDYLMNKEEFDKTKAFVTKKCSENPKALSEAFYLVHSAISQCNIILLNTSLKTLYERFSESGSGYNDSVKNDSKPRTLMIKRAVVCPTHVRFLPPQPILQSRALRNCEPEFSLRISIRDVNFETINFSFKANQEKKKLLKSFFDTYFKTTMLNGIKIGKRCYEYVGSSTSQLRGHGLWFYAKDTEGKTAATLRENFGELEKIKQVPKFMARMGQTFSQAMDNIEVPHEYTNVDNPEKDVTGGIKQYLTDEDLDNSSKFLKPIPNAEDDVIHEEPYVFSDGIGRISYEIANEVYKKLGMEEERPSAMQIRYAGCKGMLVVDPNLKGRKIIFRESMKKFGSENNSLEILKVSEKRAAALNRPLITILEQLGVSKDVFIKLQKDMIQNHITSMFHEDTACHFLNRHSQLRFDFLGMHEIGIRFTEDPLFRSMIYGLFRKNLDLLKNKANIEIPLDKGRAMFGVLDETNTLEYGQVFVCYSEWLTNKPIILTGTVVVTKNPCMHPGDVRKFEAVDVKDLHHICDCIVFPAKGPRPHPDEMAGSDLDGDEYHVMWLEDFFFERDNEDAMLYAMHKEHIKDMERTIEPSDELDHLCNYIVNDNVGMIASAHLAFADREKKGIYSEHCIRLAKKYAIALDFPKSGLPATRNSKDRVFNYPDFMQKLGEKYTYISKKALGVLYRNCKCLEMGLETGNNEVEYKVDMDLICENWEIYKKSALRNYKMYCRKVENLINTFSFDNEGELLAGAIINPPRYYEQRHDLENLKVLLEYEVQGIFRNLEKQFFNEFGGKPIDKHYNEKMFKKASAWYAVTYMPDSNAKKNRYFGFPWAVSDVLKKQKSEKCLHKGYKSANQKTLLAEIVDGSLSPHLPKICEDTELCIIYENRLDVLNVALHVLQKWLKTQREIFLAPNFKKFEKLVKDEFQFVSSPLLSCNLQYLEKLKANNCLHHAISPSHYIIETMLRVASIKPSRQKNSYLMNCQQELGLLSWITLIKLACTYNPQYLGIANKDGKYASSVFYVPQDNVISTFRVPLFADKIDSNHEFSSSLLHEPKEIIQYLKEQTKIKEIDFRFDIEQKNEQIAIFTIMGSRYTIERLKDLVVQDDFFNLIVKRKKLNKS